MGAEIGELMCSQDKSGGSSLRKSCTFTTQISYFTSIAHLFATCFPSYVTV